MLHEHIDNVLFRDYVNKTEKLTKMLVWLRKNDKVQAYNRIRMCVTDYMCSADKVIETMQCRIVNLNQDKYQTKLALDVIEKSELISKSK